MQAPPLRFLSVHGHKMAVRDQGQGPVLLFLHGNPTSSFLWRNLIPDLAADYRCVAPDLIGMGASDKLSDVGIDSYQFATHREYLDRLLAQLELGDEITLVLHDWGSALGFDWARRHAERVSALAYMEAIVRPLTWAEWPAASRDLFKALRSPAGESLILEKNIFVEKILPGSVQRELSAQEMDAYRQPFAVAGEDRRPCLAWPRQLPIDGEPADVVAVVKNYAEWLGQSTIPKLFINAEPGAILTGTPREFCRRWPEQTEVTVPGIHFIQEDSAAEIVAAIRQWKAMLIHKNKE